MLFFASSYDPFNKHKWNKWWNEELCFKIQHYFLQVLREQSVSVPLRAAGIWLITNTVSLTMAHAVSRDSSLAWMAAASVSSGNAITMTTVGTAVMNSSGSAVRCVVAYSTCSSGDLKRRQFYVNTGYWFRIYASGFIYGVQNMHIDPKLTSYALSN